MGLISIYLSIKRAFYLRLVINFASLSYSFTQKEKKNCFDYLSSKASTHCVCPCTFCCYLLKRLLPSPFYSFILSHVAFGLKLNGGILLKVKVLGWAGLYTPPLDFMRLQFCALCRIMSSWDVLNKTKKLLCSLSFY